MASNNRTHDIRKNAFDSRGKAFVKEVVKGMASRSVLFIKCSIICYLLVIIDICINMISNDRYLEMLSKLKKHYPDIDFGEVEASLHGLMEDTQSSLEV